MNLAALNRKAVVDGRPGRGRDKKGSLSSPNMQALSITAMMGSAHAQRRPGFESPVDRRNREPPALAQRTSCAHRSIFGAMPNAAAIRRECLKVRGGGRIPAPSGVTQPAGEMRRGGDAGRCPFWFNRFRQRGVRYRSPHSRLAIVPATFASNRSDVLKRWSDYDSGFVTARCRLD